MSFRTGDVIGGRYELGGQLDLATVRLPPVDHR